MNIDHLRYFLVLSQEMHYSRAAQRLNISQSGLSHAIVTLEKELGVSLFQKSGRGIALGRFGEALLPQAQQIVALADSCLRNFQMLKDGVGTIRLQTIPLLVIPTVTRLCRQFMGENPGCDFTFSTGMSRQVCQALTEGKVDIGFCSKIYSDPQLEYAPILRRSMVAAVPLDHPLAQQSSVTLEDTLPYPHVTYSWLSGQRDPVEALFAPVRDRWRIAYEVEDANFILELVAQGFGITVLLDTPPVHRPDVKVLPLTQPVQMGDFYIVRRKPPHPLANVDRFFDFCVEQARHPAQDLPPVSLPASPAESSVSCKEGDRVGTGNVIGKLGYSGVGLNKTRAHVHLELCLKLQDDFENWYSSLKLGTPNRHGAYNGLNLAGFDPAPALMQCKDGAEFSL